MHLTIEPAVRLVWHVLMRWRWNTADVCKTVDQMFLNEAWTEIESRLNQDFLNMCCRIQCVCMCLCVLEFIWEQVCVCVFLWAFAYCISGHDQISIMLVGCHFSLRRELLTTPEASCISNIAPVLPFAGSHSLSLSSLLCRRYALLIGSDFACVYQSERESEGKRTGLKKLGVVSRSRGRI